jgi:hypothetical protein
MERRKSTDAAPSESVIEVAGTVEDNQLRLDEALPISGPVRVRVVIGGARADQPEREALRVRLVDPDRRSLEQLRLGDHLIEIRSMAGHQDLTIDGRPAKYFLTAAGYTLSAASFAPPQPSLLDAVATHLGMAGSKAVVLGRRFGDDVALDPEDTAGVLSDPELTCGRKDFLQLNAGERDILALALNRLYEDKVIENFAEEHFDSWFRIHRGPAFLPWHRHFLLRFEQHLKSAAQDSRLSLPFWDWTREDAGDLDAEPWRSFFGGRANEGGQFDHWHTERWDTTAQGLDAGGHLPTLRDMAYAQQKTSFATFREIEGHHHAGPHIWVGPDMMGQRSPRDPLFYLHHCNLDRLWAIWQRNHPDVAQYSLEPNNTDDQDYASDVPLNAPMAGGATPLSMLDHTSLGYIYREDKRLEAEVLELGMPALASGDSTRRLKTTGALYFGSTVIGDTGVRLLTIRNTGTLPLKVKIDPPQPGGGPFSWSGFEAQVLPCRGRGLVVLFRPTRTGAAESKVPIWSDAPGSPHQLAVHGSGRKGQVP